MDSKFLVAMVWVLGVALMASMAYVAWDFLKWVMARSTVGWRVIAPKLGAAYAVNAGARGLIRIKK